MYHIRGWGKFNRHYGDFCTGADSFTLRVNFEPQKMVEARGPDL